MDERVFGPYYGRPPEQRTTPTHDEMAFQTPPAIARRTLRQRLFTGRRRPRTRPDHRT